MTFHIKCYYILQIFYGFYGYILQIINGFYDNILQIIYGFYGTFLHFTILRRYTFKKKIKKMYVHFYIIIICL